MGLFLSKYILYLISDYSLILFRHFPFSFILNPCNFRALEQLLALSLINEGAVTEAWHIADYINDIDRVVSGCIKYIGDLFISHNEPVMNSTCLILYEHPIEDFNSLFPQSILKRSSNLILICIVKFDLKLFNFLHGCWLVEDPLVFANVILDGFVSNFAVYLHTFLPELITKLGNLLGDVFHNNTPALVLALICQLYCLAVLDGFDFILQSNFKVFLEFIPLCKEMVELLDVFIVLLHHALKSVL